MIKNLDYTGDLLIPNNDFSTHKTPVWGGIWPNAITSSFSITVKPEIHEEELETASIFKVVVPESAKENFSVEIKEGNLFIEHKIKEETSVCKNFKVHRPISIFLETNNATASYRDGVLKIVIPKPKAKTLNIE